MATAAEILGEYGLKDVHIEPLGTGRIHETCIVRTLDTHYVAQHIKALFVPTTPDIDAVTAHLAAKHLMTPRLMRALHGALVIPDGESAWRLMTFIPGTTVEKAPTASQAAEAASFAARFHTALLDYEKPFKYRIPGYRDTRADFSRLQEVSRTHHASAKHQLCNPIAEEIWTRAMHHTHDIAKLPLRVCHGDLKLNNFRFDATQTRAIALIDLDTMGHYPLPLELGDMLRSACRTEQNTIDIQLWDATASSYRETARFMTKDEWQLIPDGFIEITLSLAARYLTDAYEEKWFAHDPMYPSLYEQNVTRARMQLALLDDFARHREQMRTIHS